MWYLDSLQPLKKYLKFHDGYQRYVCKSYTNTVSVLCLLVCFFYYLPHLHHPPHRLLRPQPLFLHKLTNEGARVCFAPELEAIDTTLIELLDLPRKCTFDLVRVDPAVMPLMGLREEPLVSPAVAPHVFSHAAAAQARFCSPDLFFSTNQ